MNCRDYSHLSAMASATASLANIGVEAAPSNLATAIRPVVSA